MSTPLKSNNDKKLTTKEKINWEIKHQWEWKTKATKLPAKQIN